MLLLHHSIEILHLADRDRGAVLLMVALNRRFIGVTAVNRDRLGEPVTADRFLKDPGILYERRSDVAAL